MNVISVTFAYALRFTATCTDHSGFDTQCRRHQKSKTGVPVEIFWSSQHGDLNVLLTILNYQK